MCAIIETCKQYGVTAFRYGGLDLTFGNTELPPSPGSSTPHRTAETIAVHPVGETMPAPDHDQINRETLEEEELRLREEEILNAPIENPVLAEQLIIDGELEDADSDEPDESDLDF